jgi:fumarate reductase flavoprotein subunit
MEAMPETDQPDVIVIGGGIAGLVAANRAAELGRRTVVLEKGTAEKYVCNSRYTYGTFHINFSDVMQDEATLHTRIIACTEGFARDDLARTVAKYGARLMRWLRAEGIELIDLGQYHTHVLSPPWRTGAGFRWDGYAGDVTLRKLEANLEKRGGTVQRGTRVNALARNGMHIEVRAAQSEGAVTFRAAAVVIADGGFQANLEMVRQYISPAPEKLLPRHGGTAMGDGLRMAQAIGAATTGMANFYGHLHSRDAMTNPLLWPRPQADDLAAAGIVVDPQGRRIADEGHGGIYLSNAIARLPDPLSTTAIFDQAIWVGPPGRGHAQPPNPLLPEVGGTLLRADTIEALAALTGMPQLKATVDQYNAALDAGTLAKLTPPRGGPAKAWPIRTAPFYALPLCSAITNTMGGIVVNGDGAVLDTAGNPIPGLYAAGSTIGGLNGGPHAGYVGGLINSVFGLRVGDVIGGFNE